MVSKNVEHLGTRKCVSRVTIQDHHKIRETIHQAARKFLLPVKTALHFAMLGDIHKRSLITHKVSARIMNSRRRVHGDYFLAILPVSQRHLASAEESKFAQPAPLLLAI